MTNTWNHVTVIGFTLLYFKMAVMPLVPETEMAVVGKLISLGNLFVRKVTWLVLITTSATLIFVPRIWNRLYDKDCLYILSSSKHSFSYIVISRDNTHSFSYVLTSSTKMYTFRNLFLSCSAFSIRLLPSSNTASEISQTPKEITNQHGRRHMPSSTRCYISIYRYLTWNT